MAARQRAVAAFLVLSSSLGVSAIRIESEIANELFVDSRGESMVDTTCSVRTVTSPERCGTHLIDGLKEIAECKVCKEIPKTIPRQCTPGKCVDLGRWARRRTTQCAPEVCSPAYTPPIVCPDHCKKIEVPNECSIKSICKYRMRAHVEGKAYTGTFESMSVEAKTNGLSVVDADPAVRDLFKKFEGVMNEKVPPLINGAINTALTKEFEKAKLMAEQKLIEQFSKDKHIFGDYAEFVTLDDFIPDADAFVGSLLPTAQVKNSAVKADSGDQIRSEIHLPGFETLLIQNFCDGASGIKFYWLRMIPFLALSAGLGYKYPRSAVAIFLVGLGISSSYMSGAMCHKTAPHLTRAGFEFKAKVPANMATMSVASSGTLTVRVDATEEGDLQANTLMSKGGIEGVIRSKIVELGDLKGKIKPLTIYDAQVEMRPEEHNLFIEPSSYVDVAGEVDMSCLPNCNFQDLVPGFGR